MDALFGMFEFKFESFSDQELNVAGFKHGLGNLGLPFAKSTFGMGQPGGPGVEEMFTRYFCLLKAHADDHAPVKELLSLICAPMRTPQVTCENQRAMLDLWTMKYIPEMELLWPNEQLDVTNELLQGQGKAPLRKIPQGYDGPGTVPDWLYHMWIANGFMPMCNHLDACAHLVLMLDGHVRKATMRVSEGLGPAFALYEAQKASFHVAAVDFCQRHLQLYGCAWTMLQEKCYSRDGGFSLVGDLGARFHDYFSGKFPQSLAQDVGHAIGFFTTEPMRSACPLPKELTQWYLRPQSECGSSAQLKGLHAAAVDAIKAYGEIFRTLGVGNVDQLDVAKLDAEFTQIVRETLMGQEGGKRIGLTDGWKKFGAAVTGHKVFGKLFERSALVALAQGLVTVAECVHAFEKCHFEHSTSGRKTA